MPATSQSPNRSPFKLQIGLIIVVGVWFLGLLLTRWYSDWDFVRSGQLGDTFGSVNALFTGLACYGVFHVLSTEQHERSAERKARLTLDFFVNHQSRDLADSIYRTRRVLFNASEEIGPDDEVPVFHVLQYLGAFRQLAKANQLDHELASSINRSMHSWLELALKAQHEIFKIQPESKKLVVSIGVVNDLRAICAWLGPPLEDEPMIQDNISSSCSGGSGLA